MKKIEGSLNKKNAPKGFRISGNAFMSFTVYYSQDFRILASGFDKRSEAYKFIEIFIKNGESEAIQFIESLNNSEIQYIAASSPPIYYPKIYYK